MNRLELVEFRRDPVLFLGAGLFRVLPMSAFAPPSRGGVVIDTGDTFNLVHYVPADSFRTLRLKATSTPNDSHNVNCQETVADGAIDVEGYYLGWKADEVHAMKLTPLCSGELFVTAKMNGCCVYISGARNAPTIIHANTQSDALEDFDLSPYTTMAEKSEALFEHQATVYRKLYAKLAQRLSGYGHIDTAGDVTVLDPPNYRDAGGYDARVFGLRRSGNWTFYYSCERKQNGVEEHVTRQLWPTFETI